MKDRLSRKDLYHDTIIAENVSISSDWTDIDLGSEARAERDRLMVGPKLREPFAVDFDLGEITSAPGQIVRPEIKLVTDKGKTYSMYFGNARGKLLASYRPETPLTSEDIYQKLQVRCDTPFEVDRIIWTTYNRRDQK